MRTLVILASVWGFGSAACSAPLPPPIAPADQGRLQCYTPDVARKTCQSLSAYRSGGDGVIQNTAVVLIAPSPPILMETVTPVEIRAGQVCGAIRPKDIDDAKFTVSGQPADPAQATRLREAIRNAMKDMFDHQICTAYVPDGDALLAKAIVDGVPRPALDQKTVWVAPDEGYKVSP